MSRTLLTGTILRSGSIPTSALGGGVVSSSAQITTALPAGTVSSSAQVTVLIPAGTVSASSQVSYTGLSSIPSGIVSASSQVVYTSLSSIPSGIVSSSAQIQPLLPSGTVSSSAQVTALIPTGTVSSSAQVQLNNISGSTFATNDFIFPQKLTVTGNVTVDTNTLFVDAVNNRVILGSTSSVTVAGQNSKLQIVDVGGNVGGAAMFYYSADGGYNSFNFAKSRGASDGSFTIVNNGDNLGSVTFLGADGSAFQVVAQIRAQVDGAPGAGDMPGRLMFFTTPSGAATPTEKMRLDASGNLGVGVTPSAWVSTRKALQTQGGAVFTGTDTTAIGLIQNGFNDGTGWKYVNNGFASRYYLNSGGHFWDTAPSGTAGDAITFTERVRITAAGVLEVPAIIRSDAGLVTRLSSTFSGFFGPVSSWTGVGSDSNLAISAYGATGAVTFFTAGGSTERMRLDASGNLGIGTTSPASIGTNYTSVDIRNTVGGGVLFGNATDFGYLYSDSTSTNLASVTSKPMLFLTNNTERVRITAGGDLNCANKIRAGSLTGSGAVLRFETASPALDASATLATGVDYARIQVYETTNTGSGADFFIAAGVITKVTDPDNVFSVASGTAGKINVTFANGTVTIQNKRGASDAYRAVITQFA